MNPESLVVSGDGSGHSLQRRLEVRVSRIDEEPLLQDRVRRQLRELADDSAVMRVFRAYENTMPLPSASFGWFDQDHHLTTEEVDGQSAEHPFGEERRMVLEYLHDPFVVERSNRRHG